MTAAAATQERYNRIEMTMTINSGKCFNYRATTSAVRRGDTNRMMTSRGGALQLVIFGFFPSSLVPPVSSSATLLRAPPTGATCASSLSPPLSRTSIELATMFLRSSRERKKEESCLCFLFTITSPRQPIFSALIHITSISLFKVPFTNYFYLFGTLLSQYR